MRAITAAVRRRQLRPIDGILIATLALLVLITIAGCNTMPPYAALHIGWTTIPPASPAQPAHP